MTTYLLSVLSYWQKGGIVLLGIAFVALACYFLFFRLRHYLQGPLMAAPGFEDRIARTLADKGWPEAVAVARHQSRFWGEMIAICHEHVQTGHSLSRAFDQVHAGQVSRWQRDIVLVKALVAAAPLLGLLGTVLGMVETFRFLSLGSESTGHLIAGGISRALITTQFGWVGALPGLFGLQGVEKGCRRLARRIVSLEKHLAISLGQRAGT